MDTSVTTLLIWVRDSNRIAHTLVYVIYSVRAVVSTHAHTYARLLNAFFLS